MGPDDLLGDTSIAKHALRIYNVGANFRLQLFKCGVISYGLTFGTTWCAGGTYKKISISREIEKLLN